MSFVKTKKAIDAKKAEEQYSNLQQFNISETAKICKNGLRIVKIANVPQFIIVVSTPKTAYNITSLVQNFCINPFIFSVKFFIITPFH